MSLYNEERPLTLSMVKGQEAVKQQLRGMFRTGNVPNAMLLVGPRGTGKTTVARIIARQFNCEEGTGKADCACASCRDFFLGRSADVSEMDAASNNKVEDVAKIVSEVQYAPKGRCKVYILDEVHMFSTGAWNALLKTIEEPPKNILFLLCTTEEQKVPATIISRCRKLYFEKIRLEEVADTLREICDKHGKAYEEDALKLVAKASDGCMRDALSIVEGFFDEEMILADAVAKTLGACREDVVFDILCAVQEGNAPRALQILRASLSRGASLSSVVKALMEAVTDAVFLSQGAGTDALIQTASYKERLSSFAKEIDTDRCIELSRKLSEVYGSITKASDASFMLENALIGMVHYKSELCALKERLSALEEGTVRVITEPVVAENSPSEETVPHAETANATVEDTPEDEDEINTEEVPFEEEEIPDLFDGMISEPLISAPVPEKEHAEEDEQEESFSPPAEEVFFGSFDGEPEGNPPVPDEESGQKEKGVFEELLSNSFVVETAEELSELPIFRELLTAA